MNRFEKHPAITILAVIIAFTILCVAVFAVVQYRRLDREPAGEEIIDAAFTYRQSSPVYHHSFRKNCRVAAASWGDITYPLSTNSLGFKDICVREVPLASDHYRLVFMGDSFTEGIGVAYEHTFAGRTAARLADCGVEVLNAAAVSYSPIIYWRKTKYLIEAVGLEFDEMVVFLDISDVRDEATSYYLDDNGHVRSRLFEDEKTRQQIIRRIRDEGAVDSLSRYMGVLLSFARPPFWETGRWTIDPDLFEKFGRPGLQQMSLYMDKLKNLLDDHGIKMTVAVFPWPLHLRENDRDSIHSRYWRNWCQSRQVDFIDYFPIFFTAVDNEDVTSVIDRYFIADDAHWNEKGHALVAEVFCRRFLERYACLPATVEK